MKDDFEEQKIQPAWGNFGNLNNDDPFAEAIIELSAPKIEEPI